MRFIHINEYEYMNNYAQYIGPNFTHTYSHTISTKYRYDIPRGRPLQYFMLNALCIGYV